MTSGESLTLLGMMAVGIVQMALNPRRAARGWYSRPLLLHSRA